MRNFHVALILMLTLAGCAGHVAVDGPDGQDAPQTSPQSGADEASFGGDDDLFAGDMPDLMVDAHARQLDDQVLDIGVQRALYDYAQEHRSDARPWLLLARDSMRRGWVGFAVRQYASAIDADARAAVQDGVLDDIVHMAGYQAGAFEQRAATMLILDVYGTDALDAIDRALVDAERAGAQVAARRLGALRAMIDE